jgi:hypothetical protein
MFKIDEVTGLINSISKKDDDLRRLLSNKINHLILYDFGRLLRILYYVDVPEHKLKLLIQDLPSADAADIITDMIIERQLQKIKTRDENKNHDSANEEDRW